jgi:hypothetical protein
LTRVFATYFLHFARVHAWLQATLRDCRSTWPALLTPGEASPYRRATDRSCWRGGPCCPRFSFTLGKKHDRRRVSIICIARVDARVEIWESLGGGGASAYTDCGEISRVVYMFGVVKGSVVSSGSKKHATNVIATATSIHQILALSSSEGQSVYTPRRRETAVLRY